MYASLYYIYIIAKNTLDQKKKVIFQMLNHTIFLLFSLYLYKYVYELSPSLHAKLPFENAVWSMSIYFVFFWLGTRAIHKTFRDDIRSGNIEMFLLRPMGYIKQKVLTQLGQGLFSFVSALVLSVGVDYLIIGFPHIDTPVALWLPAVILIFILSQMLTFILMILCGLSGFWLQDSEPIYFVVSKFIMILGGAWVPVAFFPVVLQRIAEFSPFGASMSVSFAMYPDFAARFWPLCINLIFWTAVCGWFMYVVARRAFRNLSVNG